MNSLISSLSSSWNNNSYLTVVSVVLQFMQSENFKSSVIVYDQQTSIWVDLLLQQANAVNLHHDWIVINIETKWFSEEYSTLLNPDQTLNIFFYDMEPESKLSTTIYRFNSHDVPTNNLVVSDKPMDTKHILRRFQLLYQRKNLINFAVLHIIDDGKPIFYTVNPFDIARLIEISSNESGTFEKVFFDKAKHMNGYQVIRCESVGFEQLIRLRSIKQQEIMLRKSHQYSQLIAAYFNVSVESNRFINGSKRNVETDFCDETSRWQRYQ